MSFILDYGMFDGDLSGWQIVVRSMIMEVNFLLLCQLPRNWRGGIRYLDGLLSEIRFTMLYESVIWRRISWIVLFIRRELLLSKCLRILSMTSYHDQQKPNDSSGSDN